MNLYRLLQQRAAAGRPVRVGLIGAGKFGSMFLAQARVTPGLHVMGLADLDPARGRGERSPRVVASTSMVDYKAQASSRADRTVLGRRSSR